MKMHQAMICLAPQMSVVKVLEELPHPLNENIRSVEEEIRTLFATRDTLLPKLISGELRLPAAALAELAAQAGVPDAEKFVEPACAMHVNREAGA